jgi:hypothetical protein
MKYNKYTFNRPARNYSSWLKVAAMSGVVALSLGSSSVPATAAVPPAVRELWPGQRVLMLLPLGLGEGWNSTDAVGAAVLPEARQRLHSVLQSTGKFSVIEGHRFSPLLMRAVQERRVTQEQVNTLLKDTTLGNARIVLSKISFEQPPFIADFRLEEVRAGGTPLKPTVQMQVSARLYELGGQTAANTVVVTSKSVGGGKDDVDRMLMAAQDAFTQATLQLLTPPDDSIVLPRAAVTPVKGKGQAPAQAVPPVTPVPPAPVAVPIPPVQPPAPNVKLPGDVPIAGASTRGGGSTVPQLPAPEPPLGIAVPDAPAVAQ